VCLQVGYTLLPCLTEDSELVPGPSSDPRWQRSRFAMERRVDSELVPGPSSDPRWQRSRSAMEHSVYSTSDQLLARSSPCIDYCICREHICSR
jgi:hypothetical protein